MDGVDDADDDYGGGYNFLHEAAARLSATTTTTTPSSSSDAGSADISPRVPHTARAAANQLWDSAATATDDVDLFDELEKQRELQWVRSMRDDGHTEAEIATAKHRKRCKEQLTMYTLMAKNAASLPEREQVECGIGLALAYDGLGFREKAISSLKTARETCPANSRLALFLAKLYFREDRKADAVAVCLTVVQAAAVPGAESDGQLDPASAAELSDLADAFYIIGWVQIHAGDHSSGYAMWEDGYQQVPTDPRLRTQHNKRQCWDVACNKTVSGVTGALGEARGSSEMADAASAGECQDDVQLSSPLSNLVGGGAHGDGTFNVATDCDSFAVPQHVNEPAVLLFNAEQQQRRVVFRTKRPLLTPAECANVVAICDEHAANNSGWGTVRHSSVRTTDVAVEDIAILRPWLHTLLKTRLNPLLAACYPLLADGSNCGHHGNRLRVHDAFIVRYDATRDMSLSLPAHSDTSSMSFTVALNSRTEGAFGGGGTWFNALDAVVDADIGQAVAFAGPLRHAGHPITGGTRMILVLFMYVEGFNYGKLLGWDKVGNHVSACDPDGGDGADGSALVVESAATTGEFVVYNETHELMSTLDNFGGAPG